MKKILVIGSINIDNVINIDKFPLPGETVMAKEFEQIPGGKGANQAYTIGKLGGDVTMLGCVGGDKAGEICLENLKNVNVNIEYIKKVDISTGFANINVESSGQNNITVFSGANDLVTTGYIKDNLDSIKKCDIILLQLEIPIETVKYITEIGKEHNKIIILDPAPINKMFPEEIFSKIDYIKPNEIEFSSLVSKNITMENIQNHAQELINRGVGCVLATLGKDGVYVYKSSEENFHINGNNVEVVDTTAAGDAFIGSFALGISQEKSLEEAVVFANKVASLVVTKKGAQSSIPHIYEI